ncbi:MAG: bifunctional alpha/beta hydrolase/OsmC family protein [Pseudonocardia sp.]
MTLARHTIGGAGAPLAARLDLPLGPPLGLALLAHCFTCSKDQLATARTARGLTSRGIGVLRLDFTGLGESGGEFSDSTFSMNVEDLVRAADWLRAEIGAPTLLVGHSLGGAAVIAAAARIPEVRAVVTIGAPFSPDHVTHLFDAARPEIEADGIAAVHIGGRPFQVSRAFLDDIADQPQRTRLAALDRPLLVLHAPDDDTVDVANARSIVDAAGAAASFVALDGANHLLTRAADADRVAALISAWAAPYLDQAQLDQTQPDQTAPEPGTVEVTESAVGRFTQRIRTPQHEWSADEPPSTGGLGSAPDPYQLLLSALGACTTMTMRMYAERKGWDLRRSTVTLTHDKLHAADCLTCETDTGRLDRIVREIHLDGDLDDTQRATLLAIADRCPVHRTLHSEIIIETDAV